MTTYVAARWAVLACLLAPLAACGSEASLQFGGETGATTGGGGGSGGGGAATGTSGSTTASSGAGEGGAGGAADTGGFGGIPGSGGAGGASQSAGGAGGDEQSAGGAGGEAASSSSSSSSASGSSSSSSGGGPLTCVVGETIEMALGFKTITHDTTGGTELTKGTCGGAGPEYVVKVVPKASGTLTLALGGPGHVTYLRADDCAGVELGCVANPGQSTKATVEKGASYYVFLDSSAGGGDVSVNLTLSGCGNGVIEDGEQCDDANLTNGDGCSNECKVECTGPGEKLMPGTNTCYRYVSDSKKWDDAKSVCEGWHGKLTSIGGAAEQAFVAGLIGADSWIGLRYGSSFAWIDGTPLGYTNWQGSDPPNTALGKCVHMYEKSEWGHQAGKWSNSACSGLTAPSRTFVCKRPPAGSSLSTTP